MLALSEVFKSKGDLGPCVRAKAGDGIWAVTLSLSFHLHWLPVYMSHVYEVTLCTDTGYGLLH